MADLETQIRSLADRRFAHTTALELPPDETVTPPHTLTHEADAGPINGTEMTMHSSKPTRARRNWYLLGAAAALVAVAVVGVALVAADNDDPAPPADTPAPTSPPPETELTGADGNTEAIEAFTSVVAAYEAFNSGDMATWAESYIDFPRSADPAAYDNEIAYLEAARAADARYDINNCEYIGIIESDVSADEVAEPNVVSGHAFRCVVTMTDPFTEAEGSDFVEERGWLVSDDGLFVFDGGDHISRAGLRAFMRAYGSWLREVHPDVADSTTFVNWYGYPIAEDMPATLDLLDDFVESRDK